jgi:hypothetical protein
VSETSAKPRSARLGGKAAREATIEAVWKQVTPALLEELVAFWTANGAVTDPQRAVARANEVVCVVRDENGALCGACSVQVRVLLRLRQPMYYMRMFLAKTARGMGQVIPLHNATRDALEAYNRTLERPEALGIVIEFESRFLSSRFKRAYHPEGDSTFIGYSPRGLQMRVSYFKDAVLPPPAPLPAALAKRMRTSADARVTPRVVSAS